MMFFIIVSLVIALIIIYAIIVSKPTVHMYYVIPITLISAVSLFYFFKSLLGYPTEIIVHKKFNLLSYHVYQDIIFAWIVHEHEYEPKAYQFPYTQERHAELESAMQKIRSGIKVQGEFTDPGEQGETTDSQSKQGDGNGIGTNKSALGLFHLYDVDPSKVLPRKN